MLKPLSILLGILVLAAVVDVPVEVEVEHAPLTWKQVALTDGAELYTEVCASCHGTGGKGDGPAAVALNAPVPDLTALTCENLGVFPRERVVKEIAGESRVPLHGTLDMPVWGKAFADARRDQKLYYREGLARQRVDSLTTYLETLQVE